MPILNPTKIIERETIKLTLPAHLIETSRHYCDFAKIHSLNEFFEQAVLFIFKKDKAWSHESQKSGGAQ